MVDPSWKECPFCLSEKTLSSSGEPFQKPRTVVKESEDAPPAPAPPARSTAAGPRVTEFAGAPGGMAPQPKPPQPAQPIAVSGPRVTQFAGSTGASPGGQRASGRKIVAVLATYSLNPSGDVYFVWTGRNLIGTGGRSTIVVEDPQVSEQHAVIVARGGSFLIDDNLSTNGTYLNGEELREKTRLRDGDVIKTGSTLWRFVEITDPQLEPSREVERRAQPKIENAPPPAADDPNDGFFLDDLPDEP